MREAEFWHGTPDGKIQCDLCNHYCRILPGRTGICRVRGNTGGRLCSLNFGSAVSQAADPVEKKPLNHFMPGSRTWSFGAPGCNFRCANCQNWQISQSALQESGLPFTAPEVIVRNALDAGCRSISCTYTEPTVFAEYAIEVMKLARRSGLRTVWVSNGFMSPLCLDAIGPWLDAINIDLKSMDDAFYRRICGARVEPVLDNLRRISRSSVHLEVATLLIPGHSDDAGMLERLCGFIAGELGPDVPWHATAFHPEISWKMQELPATDAAMLETAWEIGGKAGLRYIYSGDGHTDTRCPRCGAAVIRRPPRSFAATEVMLGPDGRCAACGERLPITL